MKRMLLALVILLPGAATAAPDSTAPTSQPATNLIINTDPDFTLRLPTDFTEFTGKRPPNAMYIWEQFDKAGNKTHVFVEVEKVPELPQLPPDRIHVPLNVERMYTEKWKGWDISVYVIRTKIKDEHNEDRTMITRNAAVPLKGGGLKLQVTGPESADALMNALLQELLAGLDGQTNWMLPEEHTTRTVLFAAGFAAALVLAGAVVLVRRQQWKKRRQLSAGAAMHMPE